MYREDDNLHEEFNLCWTQNNSIIINTISELFWILIPFLNFYLISSQTNCTSRLNLLWERMPKLEKKLPKTISVLLSSISGQISIIVLDKKNSKFILQKQLSDEIIDLLYFWFGWLNSVRNASPLVFFHIFSFLSREYRKMRVLLLICLLQINTTTEKTYNKQNLSLSLHLWTYNQE